MALVHRMSDDVVQSSTGARLGDAMSVLVTEIEHVIELRGLRGMPLPEAMEVLWDARSTRQTAEVQEAVAILHIVENYHRDLPENPMPGRGRLVELAAEGGPKLNEFVPLIRRGHRARTQGKWRVEADLERAHVCRSPLGLAYRVLPDGRTMRIPGGADDRPDDSS